jgi:hypothetical protein
MAFTFGLSDIHLRLPQPDTSLAENWLTSMSTASNTISLIFDK